MLHSPTPKRNRPISDEIRCLHFWISKIVIEKSVRNRLRETVFATLFVRPCSILCDMIVQLYKCFSARGAVHVVIAAHFYFTYFAWRIKNSLSNR